MEDRKQNRLAKTGEEPAQPKKKKPYATPRLVVYGDVEQLTRTMKTSGTQDTGEFSIEIVTI